MIRSGAITCVIHRHIRRPVQRSQLCEGTNLSLSEDRQEYIRSVAFGTPRSNKQQRIHGVKRRRFDEHSDNGLVQSTDSGWSTHSSADVPAVQDEPSDDHDREEDVEGNRDREVRKTEVDGDAVPDAAIRLRRLVYEHDTHRYIHDISREHCSRVRELEYAHTEPRYMRKGKATTQRFME
jgi:hypothetical protein